MNVIELIEASAKRLSDAGVAFGHGTTNAFDEAAWLVLWRLNLPIDDLDAAADLPVGTDQTDAVHELINERIATRKPAAYLTKQAWLQGVPFYVDERAIVPRSFIAELIPERFSPWVSDADSVTRILELCTGSGCLAIMMADAFDNAQVDAVDISADALAVAARNVATYELQDRVNLIQSDLYQNVPAGQYDLIITNPPYVNSGSMATLPKEYLHEPQIALAGGDDGMDLVRTIVREAADRLTEDGILMVEIGNERAFAEAAFEGLPMAWVSTSAGDDMVFLVQAQDLRDWLN